VESVADITSSVREFIVETFLEEETIELTDKTELLTGGIIDSIGTLNLVEYLEDEFDISIEPDDVKQLATITTITELVTSKIN